MGAFLRNYATRLAFICAIVALLLFIPASLTVSTSLRTFLIVMIVMLLLGGAILLFCGNRRNVGQVHYFLYDRRRDLFYKEEDLTPEIIQDAIDYYLRDFTENELALWKELPKPLCLQLEGEEQFRPLVMYRMLSILSAQDPDVAMTAFGEASEHTVTYLCRALSDAEDSELADYIYHLKKHFENEKERIRFFFPKNKRTFANRVMRYVERHFDDFYVPRSRLGK